MVPVVHQVSPEGDRSGVGALLLAECVSLSVLSHVPPHRTLRGSCPAGAPRLGGGVRRYRTAGGTWRSTVRYGHAGHLRPPWRLCVPHDEHSGAGRNAGCGDRLPEHWLHQHRGRVQTCQRRAQVSRSQL